MRYRLFFELENEKISIQYRKSVLSFIKKSLSEYSHDGYEKLYHEKDPIIKPYTFSVFFRDSEFEGDVILVHSKEMQLNFSIEDYEIAVLLYNSFNHQRNKIFNLDKNSMILKNIVLLPEKKILENEVSIKFMSPLIVRQRENEKDYYFSAGSEKFLEVLRQNIKEQLKITNYPPEIIESINLEKINGRKTVIKFYEKQMEGTIGTFKLSGDVELLNYLYKAGIGSRRSSRIWNVWMFVENEVIKWKSRFI